MLIYGIPKLSNASSKAMQKCELTGQRFGVWIVLGLWGIKGHDQYWNCRCVCGATRTCRAADLRRRNSKCYHNQHKFVDITGMRFSKLAVLEYVRTDKHKRAIWKCQCDCGNITNASRHDLIAGKKSCGCLHVSLVPGTKIGYLTTIKKVNTAQWKCSCVCGNECVVFTSNLRRAHTASCGCKGNPMIGQRFGRLVVESLHHTTTKHPQRFWQCRCDCGKTTIVSTGALRQATRSCGCSRHNPKPTRRLDLTNQRFGRLVALHVTHTKQHSGGTTIHWLCRCDCGNICVVTTGNLVNGTCQSCTCLQKDSAAEQMWNRHGRSEEEKEVLRCLRQANNKLKAELESTIQSCRILENQQPIC